MTIRIGILTISDRSSRGERDDVSGPVLVDAVNKMGWFAEMTAIVPDEVEIIESTLRQWADGYNLQVILTTGGTGFTPRDVTPEATLAVIERETPGISEAIRSRSMQITPHAMLSRAVSGIYHATLMINLPGSPKGAVEGFEIIAPILAHAVELITGETIPDSHHNHDKK